MIPLIDCTPIAVGAFEDVSFENYSIVARQLGSAMTGIGMCNLINHGVSMKKIEKVHDLSKKFFELPTATKLKYRKVSPKKVFHGYSGPGDEFLNAHSRNSPELREFWDFYGFDAFDEKMYPNAEVPGLKEALDDVQEELENAGKKFLRCIELCLKLDAETLTSKHRNLGDHSIKTHTQMRSSHYCTLNLNDQFYSMWRAQRLGYNNIFDLGYCWWIREGEWIPAVPVENANLLNSGQLLEYWTGGHFYAAPHRVRIITEGRQARDPRQSFVFVINPDGDTDVFPSVPILPEKQQQFEKFHGKPVNAFSHYQRLIEAATLY